MAAVGGRDGAEGDEVATCSGCYVCRLLPPYSRIHHSTPFLALDDDGMILVMKSFLFPGSGLQESVRSTISS